jgi:hypothetical protein
MPARRRVATISLWDNIHRGIGAILIIVARQFAVAIGVAALFPLVVYYGVNLIQPYPKFEHRVVAWMDAGPKTPEEAKAREEENRIREQREMEERNAVDKATLPFYRLLILVATPLGLAAMLIGSYLKVASVGTGLIFGGMLTVFDGYSGYWDHLDDWARFASLLVGLCVVVFLGYRHFAVARNPST